MSIASTLSEIAFRNLPQERFLALRARYLEARGRLKSIEKIVHGSFDSAALRSHLEQRLDRDFEILMVHSSVNRLKPMYTDGPLDLVRMLIEFCGATRTLAMPAFFFGDPRIGTVQETFTKNPRIDLRKTPSQMGIATELFRRSKGVLQSRHPVYRVSALGPLAEELTAGHEAATVPAGLGSPFEFMAKRKTLVIGIGKSFDVMTQVHHVEGAMGVDFPVPMTPFEERSALDITVVDGAEDVPVTLRGSGILWRFNISKLPGLLDKKQLKCWKFHNVPLFAADAGDVTRTLIEAAKRGKTLYDEL